MICLSNIDIVNISITFEYNKHVMLVTLHCQVSLNCMETIRQMSGTHVYVTTY